MLKFKKFTKNDYIYLVSALMLTLSACNLPGGTTETAAPSEAPPPTEVVVDIRPEGGEAGPLPILGSTMLWFDTSTFVYVPPGEFRMGQDEPQPSDHAPAHAVTLSGFWIHQTEVSNDQYRQCVEAGVCSNPAKEDEYAYWFADPRRGGNPVVGVAWDQAQAYCEWIEARLPTEAEWEKAARGDEGWRYPWGDPDPTCTFANYLDCLDPTEPFLVNAFAAGISPYKLLNTTGNVYEWTADWYGEDYYAASPTADPTGPEMGTERVMRGGSFLSEPVDLPVYLRSSLKPEAHSADLGFRCVLVGQSPAQACEAPPLLPEYPQPEQRNTQAEGAGYCYPARDGDIVGFNITITESINPSNPFHTWVDGALMTACDLIGGDPLHFGCWGPPLAQNQSFAVEVCQSVMYSLPPLECPPDYVLNPDTLLCEYSPTYDPDSEGCPAGYVDLGSGVCVPTPGSGSSCPPGYYQANFGAFSVCIPLDECLLPGSALIDPACQTCLDGSTYDPVTNCCVSEQPPMCPSGYYFNLDEGQCVPYFWDWQNCTHLSIYIPICPTPTPPPPVTCTNPSQYQDQTSCQAAGCAWRRSPSPIAVIYYCTYP